MTDKEIFELLSDQRTRERGFSALVKELKEKVYWQIRRMVLSHEDADDLLQDVFVKVYQNIENFNRDSNLSTWVYRIAFNHTLNFLKVQKRKSILKFSNLEDSMLENLKADNLFDSSEIEYKFQKALLVLPKKQRAVFNLRYYDELPFSDIARIMDVSESSLKSSYHFATKKIHESLLNDDNIKFEFIN